MARVQLDGGAYTARSCIANAQRCVNLYPEKNPEDAPSKYTHYPTPGLTLRSEGAGAGRGLYRATNDVLFGVEGQSLYTLNNAWGRNAIGGLTDVLTTPVSMQDNGETLVIVDGSTRGYTVDLATYAFAEIADPAFLGADKVGYVDTFLVYNRPGTQQWYCGPSNAVVPFDPLDVASKTGYPDALATLAVVHREVWLLGAQRTTEIWYNAGNPTFPFTIVAGVFIEQGCIAKYSVAQHDLMLFWLGQNAAGTRTVFMGTGYSAKRISTPAIARALGKMAVVSDAVGMVYAQDDHVFYMLTFPTADRTWVYDVSEGLWHERTWTDGNGAEHRHRAVACASAHDAVVVQDWENGNIYTFDLDVYTDAGAPIVRRRGFPHLVQDGLGMTVNRFALDMATGESSVTGLDDAGELDEDLRPRLSLRWSTDKGRTFGTPILLQMGAQGEYAEQPYARGLGLGRDFVFEVFWSTACDTALNGAWVDVTPGAS